MNRRKKQVDALPPPVLDLSDGQCRICMAPVASSEQYHHENCLIGRALKLENGALIPPREVKVEGA